MASTALPGDRRKWLGTFPVENDIGNPSITGLLCFLSFETFTKQTADASFLFTGISKSVRVSSFKGTAQNDESSCRTRGSKVSSNSLKLSYVQQDGNANMMGSPKAHDVPVSYTSEANWIASSLAFQKLFRKWLSVLITFPPEPLADDVSGQVLSPHKTFESETRIEEKEKSPLSKALWTHFSSPYSSIKLPMMIFIPLYLGVNVTYWREVSRELTPLWVIGPLVVALCVKLFRGLWALYVFIFNQTVKVLKSLPAYYLLAYKYVALGKLKQDVKARVWHPMVRIRNLDRKELLERMLGELRDWLLEKYLDFIESIWPYYCRTMRFLRRANLDYPTKQKSSPDGMLNLVSQSWG